MTKTITSWWVAAFVAFMMLLGIAPAIASAEVVYDAIPETLAPSYPSQPFQAQQTNEFGDYVHLGGVARNLTTVAVTMVNWAKESTQANIDFCDADLENCDPDGYNWPITVNVYSSHLDVNGIPDELLGTKTVTQHIPWRPESDESCAPLDNGYGWKVGDECFNYNGFAATIDFDLSDEGVVLPDDVIVGFVYNTQIYGPEPVGVPGPYNSLNIAVPDGNTASIGTDDSNDEVFWNTETAGWYSDGGAAGVGIFRKDTGWNLGVNGIYGTVAMQINAELPDEDGDGIADGADLCPVTPTDDTAGTPKLGVNRWHLEDGEFVVGTNKNEKGNNKEFTLEDTYGCGCNQILTRMGDATGEEFGGHWKFGCSQSILEDWIAGNYHIGPTYLETVSVPGTGGEVSSVADLKDGTTYWLNATGTYRFANWGQYGIADAEWAYRDAPHTPTNVAGWIKGEGYYASECGLDVQVDGSCVDWGDFSTGHDYELEYTGLGAPISFYIYDNNYSDNSGAIDVDIIEDKWVSLW